MYGGAPGLATYRQPEIFAGIPEHTAPGPYFSQAPEHRAQHSMFQDMPEFGTYGLENSAQHTVFGNAPEPRPLMLSQPMTYYHEPPAQGTYPSLAEQQATFGTY
jgi:hypothetical protein